MITVNEYYKRLFGEKVYKISLAGGNTCPNRDGSKGVGGCIFCSQSGSGDFVPDPSLPMETQIEQAIGKVKSKGAKKYIAYFQSFTATYLPAEKLEEKLSAAAKHDDIVGISVATRPDCLPKEVLDILEKYSKTKPLWVELGLQTANDKTAVYINRCYPTSVYIEAAKKLIERNIPFVTHIIFGLPGETEADMLNTVKLATECKTQGIKLQLLQILKDSPLYGEYLAGKVKPMEEDEYFALLCKALSILPENTVVHRLTGDGSKNTLVAPLWCGDKKRALNKINAILREFV